MENIFGKVLTKERILTLMRFVPAAVLLYSTIHTIEAVMDRSTGILEGAFLLVGMATVEIILLAGHALYEGNHVSGIQRAFSGLMLVWSLSIVVLNVVAKAHGLSPELATLFYTVILPSAPVQAMILTVGFFIADDEARLAAKRKANETRLEYLQALADINKARSKTKAQARTLKQFDKAFDEMMRKTSNEMNGNIAADRLQSYAESLRDNILDDLSREFDLKTKGNGSVKK